MPICRKENEWACLRPEEVTELGLESGGWGGERGSRTSGRRVGRGWTQAGQGQVGIGP
jgi:hypothetical protein